MLVCPKTWSLIPFSYWPHPVSWFIHNLYTNSSPVYVSKPYTSLKVKVAQLCLTLCDPMDYTVHGILQARILEWVTFPFSKGSSQPWDWTQVSCIAGGFFTSWATLFTEFLIIYDVYMASFSSVHFSRSVASDSLRPHELQHARPPCPSPTPRVHWDSRPLSWWCHPAISSSVIPFSSCPWSLPASESFPVSQLFAWGGQSTGVSALTSFLPKNS